MAVWGGGEELKGVLEAKLWASRQTQSQVGPTRVRAKRLSKGISE